MVIVKIICGIVAFLLGSLVQSVLNNRKQKRIEQQAELDEHCKIECEECDIELLKDEWKTTIETQMHFNDLILKFRSIVLSVFIAGLVIVYKISDNLLKNDKLLFIIILALVFWLCCFIMDYFYYQKLLIGAVNHAKKFDDNDFFRKKGLFGLNKRISFEIPLITSKILIWMFYILPLITLGILAYLKFQVIV